MGFLVGLGDLVQAGKEGIKVGSWTGSAEGNRDEEEESGKLTDR